jgi:hypothetical protein
MLAIKKEGVKVVVNDPVKGHDLSGEIVKTQLNDFMVELSVCKYVDEDSAFEINNIEVGHDGVPVVAIKTKADVYRVPIWGSVLIGGVYVVVKHANN